MGNQQLVAGEPIEVLIRAFDRFKIAKKPYRITHVRARLEPRLGVPFFRALMRVEAELLLQDADSLGTPTHEKRTPEQRRADALVALARLIAGGHAN
jgi:hypothetical protein